MENGGNDIRKRVSSPAETVGTVTRIQNDVIILVDIGSHNDVCQEEMMSGMKLVEA